MLTKLSSEEVRVLGALIEKSVTTPEQYPLSLNALCNACNQKSNRDPVVSYSEQEVQTVIDELIKKHLVMAKSGFGSRVDKYQHRVANTEFSELKLSANELGVLCVLMLRGAQTPGELRGRTQRLATFADVQEVESVLVGLESRDDGPFVQRLAREPGRRESRFIHLLGEPDEAAVTPSEIYGTTEDSNTTQRIEALEQQVAQLRQDVELLQSLLSD